MFIIIHGSHRHGYHWDVTNLLKDKLVDYNINVDIIDLSNTEFNYCCGNQVCQDSQCIYEDEFIIKYKNKILEADGIYIVTPTYFNMPPAKLKNFIDRTNALLPIFEERNFRPIFGLWVSGEADLDSIKCNVNLLKDYAEIMGWHNIEEICNSVYIADNQEIDKEKIKYIADFINGSLYDRSKE